MADGLKISALVESLLFVAGEPVKVDDLARVLEVPTGEIEAALVDLAAEYRARGLRLQRKDSRVQLVSAPEAAGLVERFLGLQVSNRLSPAALETLAVIAYRQPVTRPQVDAIRGVSSEGAIRGLLARGLIEEVGRLEQAGRPILYGTTFAFLQHFGLAHIGDLPPLNGKSDA